ncbi:hypothetical protein D3C76_1241720 [compost metagenome]
MIDRFRPSAHAPSKLGTWDLCMLGQRAFHIQQRALKDRMAMGKRQVIERRPKETEGVAMIVECLVSPLLRQRNVRLTPLK